MGGQSFKCPVCETWKLTKGAIKDHCRDKHGLKHLVFEGPYVATVEAVALHQRATDSKGAEANRSAVAESEPGQKE
jgi:hypothetical protein